MIAVAAGLADAALGNPIGIRSTAGAALSLHAEALGDGIRMRRLPDHPFMR